RVTNCRHRTERLVTGFDDLPGQKAVLAVSNGNVEDVAIFQNRLQLDQHVAPVRGQAARQTHDRMKRPLDVLDVLVAEVIFDGLHLRQPILVGVGDVYATADGGEAWSGN